MSRKMYQVTLVVLLSIVYASINGTQAKAIEEAPYEILEKNDRLELRRYTSYIVAETYVDGNFADVGSEGFRRLAAYINGDNKKSTSIAMTAPVSQAASSETIAMTAPVSQEKRQNRWRITFVMPAEYTLATLPIPTDPRITLAEEPPRYMAVVRYSGTWSPRRYDRYKKELMDWIELRDWKPIGEPVWARYDPPFMPWFLRRNEILVPVEAP